MSRLVQLRSLIVPACIGILLLVTAVWFEASWVPSKRRNLDDRNFRVLNTLSEQLSHAINSVDSIMDKAANSGIGKDDQLNKYLANVAPELEVPPKKESHPVIGQDYSDPPKIAVVADEGTHFLYFGFANNNSSGYAIRTDLDKLIEKLFPPEERNPFDVVLLSRNDGKVIFQKPSSGLVVTRIDTLDEVPEDAKKGTPSTQLAINSLSQASSREEVMLEGAPYRLYSQPVKVSFAQADPTKKSRMATSTEPILEPWVLCGLVRADHFRSESQEISYTYVLWLSALILMAIAAYSYLRLHLSNCEERLRAYHVVTTAVSACVIATVVTFALLDIYYWSHDFGLTAIDQMKKLSEAIDKNFGVEKEKAFAQLSGFYLKNSNNNNQLRIALRNVQSHFDQYPKLATNGEVCEPRWSCQISILSDPALTHLLKNYPYLSYVGWSDFRGQQRVKWTTRKSVTPFLDLDDPSILYYPDVKKALLSEKGPTDGVGTLTSPNTGKTVTVFWKLMDADGNDVQGKIKTEDQKNVFCAALITNPISVFRAILPEGFQFAVITRDGKVVFHSQPALNLREDFFAETGQDPNLRARVSMRDGGPLVANYLGRPHRMYVHPMGSSQDGSWTIVLFRDLLAEETMNLEMISLASVIFCFYALTLALALVLMWWARRDRVIGTWIRPDSRKTGAYRSLVIANIVAVILFLLVLTQLSTPGALIVLGILIPLATTVLNLLVLQKNSGSQVDSKETPSAHGPRAYVGAFATLLLVVAVLPCLNFFKVASDFEHKLFIGRTQLNLDSDIKARAEIVQSDYQGIELKDHAKELLASPENQGTLLFSYHQVLDTEIKSSTENPPPPSFMESILNNVNRLYNRLAAEQYHLAEAGSDTRVWSSTLGGNKVNLTLGPARTITSPWTPLRVLPGNWEWWLVAAVFVAVLFGLVRFTLYKFFLLGLAGPDQEANPAEAFDPASPVTTIPENLLVIGSRSNATMMSLVKDVQSWDTHQIADGSIPFTEAAEKIVQDNRLLVLNIVDHALDDPDSSRRIRLTLEKVLSNVSTKVIITSQDDPTAKTSAGDCEQWQTLLREFVRLDLKSSPARKDIEADKEFACGIVDDAYYTWRFYRLSMSQRLVLVQLAKEGLVNPNCRPIVCELLQEALIVRKWGALTINGPCFAGFLNALPPTTIKELDGLGAGALSSSLRISVWVACIGLAGFIIYTQREVFGIWITYATGLAAAVPALIKAFSVFRGKGGTEA